MPKRSNAEKVFEQTRNSSVYFESWKTSQNQHDPLISKWTKHIEKNTKKTRPKTG
jgi:hypothetical protein